MRSKDDDIGTSSIKNKMRRKKRECWTKLLRIHKRRQLTRKYSEEKKILQRMASPEELADMTEHARKAKKEIQEANIARTKARKFTKKAFKSRLVPVLGFSELNFGWLIFRFLFSEDFIFLELCPESFLSSLSFAYQIHNFFIPFFYSI